MLIWFIQFVKDNQLVFILAATAIIATMPELLPKKIKEFPQWVWTWIRNAFKTFSNLKHPVITPEEKKKDG